VNLKVIEGRLIETPVGGGVERRAFGEFVSPRGELASYAFGWTTESESHVARLTVGIGAGNPGGGSFHAVMFDNEDSYACSLVDEPFERVPEGGPDLTATEAWPHDTLTVPAGSYAMPRLRRPVSLRSSSRKRLGHSRS